MDMPLDMRINLRNAISVVAKITCISILLASLVETYFDRSFRTLIYALFLAYLLLVGIQSRNFTVRRAMLIGLVCNVFYAVAYFLVGPGSYLMAPIMTLCLAVPLLYNAMLQMNYDPMRVWEGFKKLQIALYISLAAELIVAVLGYQSVLVNLLPAGINRPSLFGYQGLHNDFAAFFNLGFVGLSSLALMSQAYGQFCVMLTILGFRYLKGPFRASRFIVFVLVPVAMSFVSPNVTSVVILVAILVATIFIKAYLKIYSRMLVLLWVVGLPMFLFSLYQSDLGFVRSYNLGVLYDIYVEPQLSFILERSLSDNIIGVDTRIFEDLRQQYEVAFLSYMSATGPVFFLVNVFVVVYLFVANIRQIKYLYERQKASAEYLEAQIMNLLFIVAMLVSTVHYAVIGTYIGSLVFILNVSLGCYFMHANRMLISVSREKRDGLGAAPKIAGSFS
jgi:hypothetical protein